MKMIKRGNYIIEDRDTYKGYEYAVTFTFMGHRCAYIILPKPIEFKNEDITEELSDKSNYWDNVNHNLDLPGGLTYLNYHNLDLQDENKQEFAIGWDYIHCWNRPNYDKAIEYFPEHKERILQLKEINKIIYSDDKHYTTLQEALEDCMKVIDQIVDKKFDFYNSSLWKPNLDTLLYSNVVQDNPSIKDFSLNDEIAHWDADINSFTINDKKVDTRRTIVEDYKIYPTFEFDSGIEIKAKEIFWEEN